jgi:hypothetical protein
VLRLALVKEAVAAQFNQNQRWVAQQALFKHAIQKIAEQSTAPKSNLGVNDIAGVVNELLDVQVTVQRQKDDGQIEVVDRKIRDVLGAALPMEWTGVPDFVKKLSGVALEPASSPGIAIRILRLAVDLADAEYRTAQVRIAMLKQRADILDAHPEHRAIEEAARDGAGRFPGRDGRAAHPHEPRRAA